MSKTQEAERHLLEAQKHLKTSLLKWRPDYESAASEFENAAKAFKLQRAHERANEAFMKAAESYIESNQSFQAAKCYEQVAGMMFRDLNNLPEALKLINKACNLFRTGGVPDTAALTYDRTAKMIEAKHPEEAASLYVAASETIMLEDRPQQAVEYGLRGAQLLVRLKKFSEAIQILAKLIEIHNSVKDPGTGAAGKVIIYICLLKLALVDTVAARQTFHANAAHVHPNEAYVLDQLITGYEQADSGKIVEAFDSQVIKNLDNEYCKLARTLQEAQREKLKRLESNTLTEEEKIRELEEGLLL